MKADIDNAVAETRTVWSTAVGFLLHQPCITGFPPAVRMRWNRSSSTSLTLPPPSSV